MKDYLDKKAKQLEDEKKNKNQRIFGERRRKE